MPAPKSLTAKRQRVALVANTSWFLAHFHGQLCAYLRSKGYHSVAIAPYDHRTEQLRKNVDQYYSWRLSQYSLNAIREYISNRQLRSIVGREDPAVLHNFTVKGIVHGTIAAKLVGVETVINSWEGLGWLFSNAGVKGRTARNAVVCMLRCADVSSAWTVVLNDGDAERLVSLGLADVNRLSVAPGVGVDVCRYSPTGRRAAVGSRTIVRALFAGRLLRDKGVGKLVAAARECQRRRLPIEVWIAGDAPDGAEGSVSVAKLTSMARDLSSLKILGHVDNMPSLLRQVDVAVYPSDYNEGLPRFLLEAASSGLPLLATQVGGIDRLLVENETGIVLQTGSTEELVTALRQLERQRDLMRRFGSEARRVVQRGYRLEDVLRFWSDLYARAGRQ